MKVRIAYVLSVISVAALSMAPGYGRPALEWRLDNLIDRYEPALDPTKVYESLARQIATPSVWADIEERANATIFKRGYGFRVVQTEHNISMIREGKTTSFFAGFFPPGKMSRVFQGGTLLIRPDGIQVHASLMVDGSLVWAFTHPDGRVYKRTTYPDGTIEYASAVQ